MTNFPFTARLKLLLIGPEGMISYEENSPYLYLSLYGDLLKPCLDFTLTTEVDLN